MNHRTPRERAASPQADAAQNSPDNVRIVLDSDNTMGLRGCDVDDGLALLYAVGHAVREGRDACAYLEAVCSSYGNSTLDAVHENTQRILRDCNLPLALYRGACDPASSPSAARRRTPAASRAAEASEAARYLARASQERPGELSLAVTGSTTNLHGALQLDSQALSRYRSVVLMGGLTETLKVGNRLMDELNLSCDPLATKAVFEAANAGARIVVVTANNCLPAHFTIEDFKRELVVAGEPGGGYLMRTCSYWFDDMKRAYGIDGFCCWDVLVTMFLLNPGLFETEPFDVVLDPRLLGAGYLLAARDGLPQARIWLPRIRNAEAVRADALSAWRAALEALANH